MSTKNTTIEDYGTRKVDEENSEEVRDLFDLYELGSRVHSRDYGLNRDFTLSHTTPELEIWANKQINIAHNLHELIKPISDRYGKMAYHFLMSDVLRKLIFTRSREGRTLKAILQPHRTESTQTPENRGIISKWLNRAPKKETEIDE